MRFMKAHIYGFGKWMDKRFTFNERGITCIIGDNESGKSTFQAFISFVLFGLPPKAREFYMPKTSGTLGGELVVLLENDEEVTIRRMDGQKNGAASCLLSSGEKKDEEWLKTILKGMTAELFASTFQFTTEDLYDFEQIEPAQIGEVLLNASISGASHVHQVEKDLVRKMDDLFKPRGTLPKLNKQLAHITTIQKQLNEHVHMTEDYRMLSANIATYNKRTSELQELLVESTKKRITWEQIETALPFMQQYEQAEKLLHASELTSLPKDGAERLEEQKRLQHEYMSNDAIIQQNIVRYEKEMEEITLLATDIVASGNAILQEKDNWSYYNRIQNDLEREKENLCTQINTKMNPYVSLLPTELLEEITFPPFIEKRWRKVARESDTLDYERTKTNEMVKEEKNKLMQVEEKIAEASTAILPKEQYNNINETLHTDNQIRTNELYMEHTAQEKLAQKINVQTSYQQAKKLFVAMNGLAIMFALIALFSQVVWFYHGAIISASFGFIQWYFKRKEYAAVNNTQTKPSEYLKTRLRENERISLQEQMYAHDRATESNGFFMRQKEEIKQTYEQVKKDLETIVQEEQELNKQIEEEVLLYPFLDRIELPYWEEIGHVLREVQSLHMKIHEVKKQLKENKHHIDAFEQKFHTYVEKVLQERTHESMTILISNVEQLIHEDVKNRQRHEKIYFEQQEALESQKRVHENLEQIEREIKAILLESHVDTEEDFFKQHEKYRKQQKELEQMENAKQQLIRTFSSTSWDAYINQEIDSHTVNYERLKYRGEIEKYEQEIEEIRSTLATSQAELNHLERADSLSYSEQMHTLEIEKELFQELAEEWATHQVAHVTLQKTKQMYMRKHVDALFKRASEHFSYVTNDRYKNIYANPESAQISVEDTSNIHYLPEELSKGTRDQLYIAIRLAMSQHIQEKTPLPFLFDDSFVHFDKKRTERMIQLIVRLAEHQQVILFTCKDEIEQMMAFHTTENGVLSVRIQ